MNHHLITTAEAAILHRVQPATIRSWVRRGLLTAAIKIGATPYYRLGDVDEAEYQARKRDTTGKTRRRTET